MKKVNQFGNETYLGKREINGNHYVVVVFPFGEGKNARHRSRRRVTVYGGEEDKGYPDLVYKIGQKYDQLASITDKSWEDKRPLENHISEVVNEAVCTLEDRIEDREETLGKVEAALEANAEVHGGIDYQLEQEKES